MAATSSEPKSNLFQVCLQMLLAPSEQKWKGEALLAKLTELQMSLLAPKSPAPVLKTAVGSGSQSISFNRKATASNDLLGRKRPLQPLPAGRSSSFQRLLHEYNGRPIPRSQPLKPARGQDFRTSSLDRIQLPQIPGKILRPVPHS